MDTPEAWALDVCKLVKQSYEPADVTVASVMQVAGDVVDPDAEGDPADPYVLAQALEIREAGRNVCVVTNDVVDRVPIKISMRMACERLHLRSCDLAAFMTAVDFDPKTGWAA